MKKNNNDSEQNQNELKDDNGNSIRSVGGPDFKRLLMGMGVCLALLIIAKLLGM